MTTDYEFPGLAGSDAPVWQRAWGETVLATDGREYVDFAMGFGSCLFGHGAVYEYMRDLFDDPAALAHGLGDLHSHELRQRATRAVCERAAAEWPGETPEDLRAVLLGSGSEAVETALKTAVLATGRNRFVAFEGAYHGTFGLSLAVTHGERFRAPFASHLSTDVTFVEYGSVPELDETVAAVIVEPVLGRAGVVLPPDGFLEAVREQCTASGALLIVDAVLTGCGRAAGLMHGAHVQPDILCLGKALAGGVAASATVARRAVADAAWSDRAPEAIHTATFLAHPVSCAAILVARDMTSHLDMMSLQERISLRMREIAQRYDLEVRGSGALWCIDGGGEGAGVELSSKLQQSGVIAPPSGTHGECVTLTPSLHTRDDSFARLDQALAAALAVPA